MTQLNRVNVPTTPGVGTGVGVPAQQPASPAGNPLRNTTGLSTRTTSGPGPMRNASLPPLGGTATGPSRMGPRPMPAPQAQTTAPRQPVPSAGAGVGQARPTPQQAGPRLNHQPPVGSTTTGRTSTARPASQTESSRPATPPPVPPHTSSLQGQKPQPQPINTSQVPTAETGLPTPPLTPTEPSTGAAASTATTATTAMPTPMQATGLSLMEQALNDAIQQGVDPMVAMQACLHAWGIPSGGMGGLPGTALALGNASVGDAQFSMDGLMGHMKEIMMMQMKSQTEMAIMKMIVDMNMALAKEIKKSGQAIKDLAG